MLNFTRQERFIIIFLVVTLGLGALVRAYRESDYRQALRPQRFDDEAQRFQEVSDQLNAGVLRDVDSTEAMEATLESVFFLLGSADPFSVKFKAIVSFIDSSTPFFLFLLRCKRFFIENT